MLWINKGIAFLLCISAFGCTQTKTPSEACPIMPNQTLRYVDIFDGKPAELAILMPDAANEQ